jgi:hypothetical protein
MSNILTAYPEQQTDGLINNPDLSNQLVPQVRAVKDTGQAQRIVKAMISYNRERMIINARITAKYNAEKPYRQKSLEAEGLGWRSNFTTKPLPNMVDKVAPRFVEAIQGLKYLTNSQLPPEIPGATRKSDIFRKKVSDLIRGKKGWVGLLEEVAQENALFGYTGVAWLDEYTWFPTHFRQDHFFLPQGTKQTSDSAQVVMLKEVYMPHELFAMISEDREAAELAGWDIPKTVEQINKAVPDGFRSKTSEHERQYEDMRRELNVSFSFESGARTITVWSLLVREVTGKVSHFRLAGDEMSPIFQKNDRFETMQDCTSFYAFQKGNSTMHGSKGVGREIYELAGIIDRSRNEVVDRLMLSGKMILQTEAKNVKRFRMSVVGNAILIDRGFTIAKQTVDGNVEPFIQLDSYLGLLVDQLIGSVSPRQLQGERVTKAQVDLFAQREEEAKDTKITRFIEQFVNTVDTMQKRILDPDTADDDAKKLQKELKEEGLTSEEIDMLRKSPVAGTVAELTPLQRQQLVLIAQENRGNPLYNQRALEEEKIIAQVNSELAEKLLLPDEDPTVTAEQTRLQQMELALLTAGQAVPVSPRDNHKIHLGLIVPTFEVIATAIHKGQASTDQLQLVFDHANEHFNLALSQGTPAEEMADVKANLNNVKKILVKLRELDKEAETLGAANQALKEQDVEETQQAANSLAISAQLEQGQ